MKKVKQHTIYKNSDGKRVPGTTTIIGVLNKPALLAWANRIGLEGIEMSKYVDDLAEVGTLAHEMVKAHFTGEKVDTDEYSKKVIDRAENAMISFLSWVKGKNIEPIYNEKILVSDKLGYGGTLDMYCKMNDKNYLIDFKTGSGIYDDHFYQMAGYKILLEEQGHKVDAVLIVNIPRAESEKFQTEETSDMRQSERVFRLCLELYQAKKGTR
jgi:hypothetical protein